MKGFNAMMQRIFTAAAFAEAGEFETAREVLREKGMRTIPAITIPKKIRGVQASHKVSNSVGRE